MILEDVEFAADAVSAFGHAVRSVKAFEGNQRNAAVGVDGDVLFEIAFGVVDVAAVFVGGCEPDVDFARGGDELEQVFEGFDDVVPFAPCKPQSAEGEQDGGVVGL